MWYIGDTVSWFALPYDSYVRSFIKFKDHHSWYLLANSMVNANTRLLKKEIT